MLSSDSRIMVVDSGRTYEEQPLKIRAGHGGIYLSHSTLEAEAGESLRSRITWSTKRVPG